MGFFFLLLFFIPDRFYYFLYFIVVLVGVHFGIYKHFYNISNVSYLNLPPPPFSFIFPSHSQPPFHMGFRMFFCGCYFAGTGVRTQGLALARKVLYHLSHTSSPNTIFLLWILFYLVTK
jgi:hypothetical protein